jgi:hypothetical protein
MDRQRPLSFLTNTIFAGFALSVLYGAMSAAALWRFGHASDFEPYLRAYFVTFNCAVSGGLVFATAFVVYRTQNDIPDIIENNFTPRELEKTGYLRQRTRFFSAWRTCILSSGFAGAAGFIFYYAQFPFRGLPRDLLIAVACIQYAAGVYIGRKLFHIGGMLRLITHARITKDIFSIDSLSWVSTYVNSVSTVTAITVYAGVRSYYSAHFVYKSVFGESVKTAMLLPAIIAIPVLVFSYYSRSAVKKVYERSIEMSLEKIRNIGKEEGWSKFETDVKIIMANKALRDELNSRLRTTLEDLPMVVVVGIALLGIVRG